MGHGTMLGCPGISSVDVVLSISACGGWDGGWEGGSSLLSRPGILSKSSIDKSTRFEQC